MKRGESLALGVLLLLPPACHEADDAEIIFDSAECVKDGLLPLTERLGPGPPRAVRDRRLRRPEPEAVVKALGILNEKYRNYPWEGTGADGYADALEGALNLAARETLPSVEQWIDGEIRVMWNRQHPSGIIDGWHCDGNFARTTLMCCLWKTQGALLVPWREDLEIGAVRGTGGKDGWCRGVSFRRGIRWMSQKTAC